MNSPSCWVLRLSVRGKGGHYPRTERGRKSIMAEAAAPQFIPRSATTSNLCAPAALG
jgi:hypothetical protein